MRLLLDTNALLWVYSGAGEIGPTAIDELATAQEIAVSVVAFVEIGIKAAVGKVALPDGLDAAVEQDGLRILGLKTEHGLALARLPLHHRDPFDRLLVVQAQLEAFTILSADAKLHEYGVPVLDPRR